MRTAKCISWFSIRKYYLLLISSWSSAFFSCLFIKKKKKKRIWCKHVNYSFCKPVSARLNDDQHRRTIYECPRRKLAMTVDRVDTIKWVVICASIPNSRHMSASLELNQFLCREFHRLFVWLVSLLPFPFKLINFIQLIW